MLPSFFPPPSARSDFCHDTLHRIYAKELPIFPSHIMIYALPVTAKSIYEPKYARSAALDVSSTRSIEAVQKKDVILCIISIGHSDTQLGKRREKIRYLVIKTSPREPMRCMYQVATGASHLTVIIHRFGWVFCQLAAL